MRVVQHWDKLPREVVEDISGDIKVRLDGAHEQRDLAVDGPRCRGLGLR